MLRNTYERCQSSGVGRDRYDCYFNNLALCTEIIKCQKKRKKKKCKVSVLWFRHGLRLHDNPALLETLKDTNEFYPIFIFDGESAGTKTVGYNHMCFLLEALNDLNEQLKIFDGKLYMFRGSPTQIFKRMWEELALQKICFEQDCEPIWSKCTIQ